MSAFRGVPILAGDLDSNDKPGFAALSAVDRGFSWYSHRAGRAFETRASLEVGETPSSLAPADLNLDGAADDVAPILECPRSVSVIRSQGGALLPAVRHEARQGENHGHCFSVAVVIAADLNGFNWRGAETSLGPVSAGRCLAANRSNQSAGMGKPVSRRSSGSRTRSTRSADGALQIAGPVMMAGHLFEQGSMPRALLSSPGRVFAVDSLATGACSALRPHSSDIVKQFTTRE